MFHGRHVTTRLTRPFSFVRGRSLLTLAIETSCDDTCVAILEKPSKLDAQHTQSSALSGQAQLHFNKKITLLNNGWTGIHPLDALDSHRANLAELVKEALPSLPDASLRPPCPSKVIWVNGSPKQKPDLVAATRGPGMRSNLSCGLDTAKGLATAWQVPFIGVHHMQAHALTPRLVEAMKPGIHDPDQVAPSFPFLTLLVSGGHTMLLHSKDLTSHHILATTRDIAIGDALDKCGRRIVPQHLSNGMKDTAFGKHLSQFAFPSEAEFSHYYIPRTRAEEIDKPANEFGWQIQSPFCDTRTLAFSFAGISSEMERIYSRRLAHDGADEEERLHLARVCLGTAFEHLASRTIIALESLKAQGIAIPSLVVSGGVAANDFLRFFLRHMLNARGFPEVRLIFPPVSLCTDNAAMIAWSGVEMFEAGYHSSLGIHPLRKWSMDPSSQDGGILGVGGWSREVD